MEDWRRQERRMARDASSLLTRYDGNYFFRCIAGQTTNECGVEKKKERSRGRRLWSKLAGASSWKSRRKYSRGEKENQPKPALKERSRPELPFFGTAVFFTGSELCGWKGGRGALSGEEQA